MNIIIELQENFTELLSYLYKLQMVHATNN